MNAKNILLVSAAFAVGYSLKEISQKNEIELDKFIENAIALGIAEIESAKLALEKSTSTNIKIFAQRMIDDHTLMNQQLFEMAKKRNLPEPNLEQILLISDTYLIQFNDAVTFDESYVEHQLKSPKNTIKLLNMIGRSDDEELQEFYSRVLGKIDNHLHMAQTLADTFHTNTIHTSSPQHEDYVEEPNYKV